MARKLGLFDEVSIAREFSGVIAADSATLSDANFPVAQAIGCQGYDTILVGVEIDGGASPTCTVEALFRDGEAADGSRWKRIQLGAPDGVTATALAVQTTPALTSNGDMVELRVFGRPLVMLRRTAVTNSATTTAMRILVAPGRKRLRS